VISADGQSPSREAQLLRVLALQHVEVNRLTAPATAAIARAEGSKEAAKAQTFPTGGYVIRMDQPYTECSVVPCYASCLCEYVGHVHWEM
jgi:hypothetical protein